MSDDRRPFAMMMLCSTSRLVYSKRAHCRLVEAARASNMLSEEQEAVYELGLFVRSSRSRNSKIVGGCASFEPKPVGPSPNSRLLGFAEVL